jgi:hypothetical protein
VRATTAFNKMLAIPGADVAGVQFTPTGIVVALRRRARRLRCPCGWSTRAVYDRSTRRWRHLDLGASRLYLEAEIRLLACRACGRVRTETVPWAGQGRGHRCPRPAGPGVRRPVPRDQAGHPHRGPGPPGRVEHRPPCWRHPPPPQRTHPHQPRRRPGQAHPLGTAERGAPRPVPAPHRASRRCAPGCLAGPRLPLPHPTDGRLVQKPSAPTATRSWPPSTWARPTARRRTSFGRR